MKIAICDDELYFRERIKKIIAAYMGEKGFQYSIDCFESGVEFLKSGYQKTAYEIIFLDINMKEIDGIETAKAIRNGMPGTYIVFVTAYITYALAGYTVNAFRFILKEAGSLEMTIHECLDSIAEKIEEKDRKITISFQNGKTELYIDRILYVESRLHKVIFFVWDKGMAEYSMNDKLDNVEQMLSPFGFCRIHQSFLVNMRQVKSIKRYSALLWNGKEINISKKNYKQTKLKYLESRGDI